MELTPQWFQGSIPWPENNGVGSDSDSDQDDVIGDDPESSVVKTLNYALDQQRKVTTSKKQEAANIHLEEEKERDSQSIIIVESDLDTIKKTESAFKSAEEALNQARASLNQAEQALRDTKA